MTHSRTLLSMTALALTLAACGQTSAVSRTITIDPVLSKYDGQGGGGCPSGQTAGAGGICYPPPGQGYQPPTGTQIPGTRGQSAGSTGPGGQSSGGRR